MFRRIKIAIFSAMVSVGSVANISAESPAAEDFRVENAVYLGDDAAPASRSTTIFTGGLVYDCMETPAETVIFDRAAGRFTFLNREQQSRTELTTAEVAALIDRLQPLAAKSKDPLIRFLAEPKFEESIKGDELTLNSPLVRYRLHLSPTTASSVVEQYHEFCDWYARVNSILVPGSRPPFARLVVNAALAQRGATASQVVLTLTSGKGLKQQRTTIRSEHRLVQPLDASDLEQVAEARNAMTRYKLISFEQYRQLEPR